MTLAGNPISMDVINKLMKSTNKEKSSDNVTGYKERWPGEADLLKLARAVDCEADTVKMRDGSMFSISYFGKKILVQPVPWTKFIPMGWFDREVLETAKLNNIDPDE